MLIDMKVFKSVSSPRFSVRWEPKIRDYVGEDWGFCEKAEKSGFQIWVDHKLSLNIGHIGLLIYEHDVVEVKETKAGAA